MLRIRSLDDRLNYALQQIRVKATIGAKGHNDAIYFDKTATASHESKLHASNIIVSTSSHQALRVVRSDITEPLDMLKKLDTHYDSQSTALRISNMSKLGSSKNFSLRDSISTHVDKIAALIKQIRSMGTTFEDTLAVGMLVASIQVAEPAPITAFINTLSDDRITWDADTTQSIKETQSLSNITNSDARANAASGEREPFHLCKNISHRTYNFFLNLLGGNSKIDLQDEVISDIMENGLDCNVSTN